MMGNTTDSRYFRATFISLNQLKFPSLLQMSAKKKREEKSQFLAFCH